MTRNGGSSRCVCPSIVTWRSCIASSSAACVFGGARLISSERRRLVKIGPGRNSKSPSRWFQIDEPVTSDGMRSGVNWIRAKRMLSTCANERAASVLASPGKSSSSTCPSARKPSSTSSSDSRLPTTASLDLVEDVLGERSGRGRAPSDRLERADDAVEVGRIGALREPILGRGPVGPDERPRLVAEDVRSAVRGERACRAVARRRPAATERSRGARRKWRSNELATPSATSCSMRLRLGGAARFAGAAGVGSRSGVSSG